MKTFALVLLTALFTTPLLAQNSVTISELDFLDNTSWNGNLMYINYADGQEVNLRTTMQIRITKNAIQMNTQFTDEPGANSKSIIKLKKAGTYFGAEKIIAREKLKNGSLQITTSYDGNDDNKPATILKTYLLGEKELIITKEVNFKDSEDALIRNRYTYIKL
ncbi:hypothetical protein FGM00_07840 [Aggregatimonas sangjinii]|uniref:Lipocalin-like domain-containing protein n=1 Tax=Aggregatimonas sangjinii TaxID=2583587 RepID=A0A5B7STJ0_9FLAO|nr:hypothetical protein [Aggregatimonas sangjinii]QCX00014.1 hypothetical protein FGM00_07840 [Aggregatimonas sangjinii]